MTESNIVSVSILFKTNYAGPLAFLKIVDNSLTPIFSISDNTISINHVDSSLP